MEHCKLIPFAVCRVPAFITNTELPVVWDELKAIISESSPDFYDLIKDCDASHINSLNEKIRFTIFKYFNRARFRATPYGKFASLTMIPVTNVPLSGNEIVLGDPLYRQFVDWRKKSDLSNDVKSVIEKARFYETNATVYLAGNKIKYLFFNGKSFELSSVNCDGYIDDLLNFTREKRSKNDIINFFSNEKPLPRRAVYHLLKQLIGLQLLLTDMHPNIIGPDFFKRNRVHEHDHKDRYTITERQLLKGSLDSSPLRVLTEAILFLNKHLPYLPVADLQSFKERFRSKFEQLEVPLPMALDPQTGVGYGNLESDHEGDTLIHHIKQGRFQSAEPVSFTFGEFHKFILPAIIEKRPVQLELLRPSQPAAKCPALPNTFNAIITQADGWILCERAGGSTANSLLGRFSVIGGEFEKVCMAISEIERNSNPGVEFFDVGYMAEENVDNVNRRALLYHYELPIISYSTGEKKLELDDIMVSVREGDIILRSKKLGKRIMPRIASAYNYTRSDLPLFRFLSDLQTQNIRLNISCDIQAYFPGLDHYPRVQYKNVIFSRAKWLVPGIFLNKEYEKTDLLITKLKNWLVELRLTHFRCGTADQKLTFNCNNENDLHAFLTYSKNKPAFYIEEHISTLKKVITEEKNGSFEHEFILNFYHEDELYKPVNTNLPSVRDQVNYSFLPGNEWLYFEIYCHHSESDFILNRYIRRFVSEWKTRIKTWFFIRYDHPAYHIRLRIKLKDLNDGYTLIRTLSGSLKEMLSEGTVSALQIKTYFPEIERYGTECIRMVEKYFCASSEFALKVTAIKYSNEELYMQCMHLLEYVLETEGYTCQEMIDFCSAVANSFAIEFGTKHDDYKKINSAFKSLDFSICATGSGYKIAKSALPRVKSLFIKALHLAGTSKKKKLISDLFHMHVNRLFETDQRIHEMLIYHFLLIKLKGDHFKTRSMLKI